MKITEPRRVPRYALGAPASGITIADPGGFFGSPGTLTLEELIALLGPGLAPGAFLRVVGGERHTVNPMATFGATPVVDLALGNEAWGTLDQDATVTFTGWTNGEGCRVMVEVWEDSTGGWTPTFSGVTWLDGTTPVHDTTADTVTHYAFFSRDGGTTIWGGQLGSNNAAALHWIPMTVFDPTTGNWLPLVDGSGNQIMAAV